MAGTQGGLPPLSACVMPPGTVLLWAVAAALCLTCPAVNQTCRLTDSKGRTVAFNNTIIIMTSNLVGL